MQQKQTTKEPSKGTVGDDHPDSQVTLVEDHTSPSTRKRNRKKKLRKPREASSEHKRTGDNEEPSPTSVAHISASFIPIVQETIQLLQTHDGQMSSSEPSCAISSFKKSKKNKKCVTPQTSAVEKIFSPGAQRLASEQTASVTSDPNFLPQCGLNSEELKFMLSASKIGPIYCRSSLCSSVTVTSSSLSSQLSSERIQNSHLYSNIPQPTAFETPAVISAPTVQEMNAPVVQKSREEVEAERKARKAAKQAAKTKGKASPCDAVITKVVKKGDEKQLVKEGSVNQAVKEAGEKLEKLVVNDGGEKLVIKEGEKSKAELRAERRAKQEAQRAAKAQQLQEKQPSTKPEKSSPPSSKPSQKNAEGSAKLQSAKKVLREVKDMKAERRVKLFSHLYQDSFKNISQSIGVFHPEYHLAIVRLGVQYANRVVLGSNARCLALLYSLKQLISDYETPPQKEFSRGLESFLQPNMDFLHKCRPHSVSMINALRHIKWQLTQLRIDISDTEARQQLQDAIDQYINEQIEKAAEAIGKAVSDKIADNDVILVYACSSLVLSALKVALDEKRKFRVVVVDSLPWLEGREMLRRLVSMGVQCSYVHLSAASFVMRHVSKVLLGAHALLANGYVMSRAGSSQVALLAHEYNVPVLVCCETHKFSERVQTDSFVYNELGDPDELIGSRRAGEREVERERPLANWRDLPSLSLLNLVYDVTPPDLVTAVVTERAILPCTSVPVILRIKPLEC